MKTFYRHQLELLQIDMKITELSIQKTTWEEINETKTIMKYDQQIKLYEEKKETYLNQLFLLLNSTEITTLNCEEIKLCYKLLEKNKKTEYSVLFSAHLNRTIEKHQKKYGGYLIKSQIKKAYEIENTIHLLEKSA